MIEPTRPPSVDYRAAGLWEDRTLGSVLAEAADAGAERLALVDGDTRLTYGELLVRARAVASGLRTLGAGPGDVLTMQTPNWWESAVLHHALMLAGLVVNPVVPIYRDAEVTFILRQARPKVVVVPHVFRRFDFVALLERVLPDVSEPPRVVVVRAEGELPDGFVRFEELLEAQHAAPARVGADDVCLLLYTSGTTADPKGVLHNHQTLVYECRSIAKLFSLGASDNIFMASPLTHITGVLYALILPPLIGGRVTLLDVWDPETGADLIERQRCTFTVGATPFLQGLTDVYAERGVTSSLRAFACGGADVPPELVRRARSVLDCAVVRVYGSSEMPTLTCGRPDDPEHLAAETDGRGIGPVEFRLLDEHHGVGELAVRGPELFLGYLDPALNDDAFPADGFFATGDLASVDDDGAITIRGRKKDIIIRGGENISAKEVEDLLYASPHVREVAVVAMPDAALGEKVCAFVVPDGGAEPDLSTLVAYLEKHRIAKQKFPERVELVDELPKTASGKVQKFLLRDRIRALVQQEAGQRPVSR